MELMARIQVLEGPMKGARFEIDKEVVFVGRDPENDIQIRDNAASGKHLKIINIWGCYFIEALKTENGTMINGGTVDAGFARLITENDSIQLGSSVIRLDEINVNTPPITGEEIEPRHPEKIDGPRTSRTYLGEEPRSRASKEVNFSNNSMQHTRESSNAVVGGQLVRCPKCKQPIRIPFPATGRLPHRTQGPNETTPSPASLWAQADKGTSRGLRLAVVALTVICVCLAGGILYLIKANRSASALGQKTLVAPIKEAAVPTVQNAQEESVFEKIQPDLSVDGEVFFVKKDGERTQLELIEVVLIPMETLTPYIDSRTAERMNGLAALAPQIKAGEAEVELWEHEVKSRYNALMKDVLNESKKKRLHSAYEARFDAVRELAKLKRQAERLMSSAFYFESLPSPLRRAKTTSDGRFRLLVPASGSYAIAAQASRHVVKEVERYYWLLKIDPKAGTTQSMMLSNDNMTSSKSVNSLISTL
jgi:pSer/pThr/pTyr-binding forkhead associated (FHA) protein